MNPMHLVLTRVALSWFARMVTMRDELIARVFLDPDEAAFQAALAMTPEQEALAASRLPSAKEMLAYAKRLERVRHGHPLVPGRVCGRHPRHATSAGRSS